MEMKPIVKEIEARSIITKSNLPVCDFSVNPYTGCEHACKYCYASFIKLRIICKQKDMTIVTRPFCRCTDTLASLARAVAKHLPVL